MKKILLILLFLFSYALYSQTSIAPFSNICSRTPSFTLTNGSPAGGTYSGQGISANTFNPGSVSVGTHTITYTANGQSASTTITIIASPNAAISVDYQSCNDTSHVNSSASCRNYSWYNIKGGYYTTGIVNVCAFSFSTYSVTNAAGNTYNWIVTGGSISSGQGTATAIVNWGIAAQGKLKVVVVNSNGCRDSSEICISIKDLPTVNFTASNACLGIPTQFTNLSTNGVSWYWEFGDGTTSTLQNPEHMYAAGGSYNVKLVVKTQCGCEASITKAVAVNPVPGPKIICPSTACSGDSMPYSTDSNCGSYNWSVTGGSIISGQNTNQVLVNWGTGPAGTISLSTSGCNPVNCSTTTTVNIPILPTNPVITGPTVVCTAELKNYNLPSWPGAKYDWSIIPAASGNITSGQSSNQVNVQWQNPSNPNAKVIVSVGSPFIGCQSTDTLDVLIKPYFNVSGSSPVCRGSTTGLTASPSGSFSWSVSGGNSIISGQGTSNATINWSAPSGTYTITVTSLVAGAFCNSVVTRNISVKEVFPIDSITGPKFICPRSTYVYNGQITPAIGGTLNWSVTNGTLSATTGSQVSVTWGTTGPYSITVVQRYQGCTSSPVTLPVNSILVVPPIISGSQITCSGNSQTFTYNVPGVATSGITYVWAIDPPTAGSIITGQGTRTIGVRYNAGITTATVNLAIGVCSTTITAASPITILPSPVPGITATNLCPDSFINIVSNAVFPSYYWYTGATTQSIRITTSGFYTLLVTAPNGCTGSVTRNIPMQRQPQAAITTDKPRLFCIGTPINVVLNAPVGQGYNFQWYKDGLPVGGNSSTLSVNSRGSYSVVVTNAWGCINSSSARIDTITCPPLEPGGGKGPGFGGGAGASGSGGAASMKKDTGGPTNGKGKGLPVLMAQQICSNRIQYTDLSPPTPIAWWWDFGDPSSGLADTSTLQNPLHVYAAPGYYFVGLWARYNPTGSWVWDTLQIEIPAITDFDAAIGCPSRVTFYDLSTRSPGTTISSWDWNFGDGTTSTAQNPVHNYASGGVYSVTLTITAGSCSFKKSHNIIVPNTPTANFSFPEVACSGTPTPFTDLSVGGGASLTQWSWNFGDGATSNLQTPIRTYAPGTYTVTLRVTNSNGCTSTQSHTLSIGNSTSTGTITATKAISATGIITFCADDSVTLTSSPATTYLWSNGSTQQSITVNQPANYSVITYNVGICQSATPPVTVTLKPLPTFTINPTNAKLCSGGNSVIYSTYSSSGAVYRWHNSSGPIPGSAGASYYYNTNVPGTFTLVVIAGNGCTFSNAATVVSVPAPVVNVSGVAGLCPGESAILTAAVVGGTAPFNYYWSNGQRSSTLNIFSGGYYSVNVSDSNSCWSGDDINVVREPGPDLSLFPLGCYTRCVSETVFGPPGYASYNWMHNGTNVGSSPDLFTTQSGTYNLIVTTAFGCKDTSGALNLTIAPLPVANAGPDKAICPGDSTQLHGTGANIYTWTPASSLNSSIIADPMATPNSTTDYELLITDINGCKDKDSVLITVYCNLPIITASGSYICAGTCATVSASISPGTGTPPFSYSWSSGHTGAGPHSLCPNITNTYTVTVTDSLGFQAVATLTVGVYPKMILTPTSTNVLCKDAGNGSAGVDVTGGTPLFNYFWTPTGIATYTTGLVLLPGTYTVTVTDANGCYQDTIISITEPPQLIVSASSNAASCGLNNGSAIASTTGGSVPYNYHWSNSSAQGTMTGLASGIYTVTVTDANGCSDSSMVTITDTPVPVASYSANDTVGCPVLCANFTNTSTDTAATWNFGDGTTGTGKIVTHCYVNSGSFAVQLTVTDPVGCTASLLKNNYVTVYPEPTAAFNAQPQPTTILNPVIQFNSQSTGGIIYDWEFGDNSGSADINPKHAYENVGRYQAILIVENQFGCEDTFEQTIIIDGDFAFYIPNAFTPNGDNTNNFFFPVMSGVEKYEMWIYDRWGNRIWHSNEQLQGWNGKVEGSTKLVQEDVYVWVVWVTDIFNKRHKYIGHVTVIR